MKSFKAFNEENQIVESLISTITDKNFAPAWNDGDEKGALEILESEMGDDNKLHIPRIMEYMFGIDINEGFEDTVTKKFSKKYKINYNDAAFILFGGGNPEDPKVLDKLIKQGYDDGATSYKENEKFWKGAGISKSDYDKIVKLSV